MLDESLIHEKYTWLANIQAEKQAYPPISRKRHPATEQADIPLVPVETRIIPYRFSRPSDMELRCIGGRPTYKRGRKQWQLP